MTVTRDRLSPIFPSNQAVTTPRGSSRSADAVYLNEGLILLRPAVRSSEAVIRALGRSLAAAGCVRRGFTAAVLRHERDYPTGLAAALPLALPHAEADFCRRPALAVAVLDPPIPFGRMGEKEGTVAARIVFMPTVPIPDDEIPWMVALAELMRRGDVLESLASTRDRRIALRLLRSALRNDGEDRAL